LAVIVTVPRNSNPTISLRLDMSGILKSNYCTPSSAHTIAQQIP
jgi:hypothetical protein